MAQRRSHRRNKRFKITGTDCYAIIGIRARCRDCRLGDVHAAHVAGFRIAPRRVITSVLGESGKSGVEKVSVERNDDIGILQLVLCIDLLAECHV